MLTFHAVVYHDASDAAVAPAAIPVPFDRALGALSLLPRLFIEPDGSFICAGKEYGQPWQVDGNLLDRGDVLACVELKGSCPEEVFDELLEAIGWPRVRLVFQLPQRGLLLAEAAFRELAATEAGAV